MLFNSYTFIFAFLPIALLGYLAFVHFAPRQWAIRWLIFCSLFFYGWWQPQNLWILLFLLLFNYGLGVCLGRLTHGKTARLVLVAGLAVNLGMLCYYKYANFFAGAVNDIAGTHFHFAAVILPLGISFFVFQKIAYLVDAYRHEVRGYSLTDYSLFVTFFPQLIAGPIVHHSEVVPQFSGQRGWRPTAADFSIGVTQFAFGLFKKVVLADGIAQFANPVFDAARSGAFPSFCDSWIGALAYTFQLYFDFSGYSDMALGLGRLFGIKLPQNFNSPYKAASIADFWRRWHMTLSRFLRDYLYIPLGGNRRGPTRRCINLMVTMLLGGLWHGAGWTFVCWGGLHGTYLLIHRAWQPARARLGFPNETSSVWGLVAGRFVTFLAVMIAWVFFRAANLATAFGMLQTMAGTHGFGTKSLLHIRSAAAMLAGFAVIVWCLPNTQELLGRFEPALRFKPPLPGSRAATWSLKWISWRPTAIWAFAVAALTLYALSQISRVNEFIYWQF
jgi:D-alanyl-lipoteichoic acid acyltransferase DltB (MBOAT superfamily)